MEDYDRRPGLGRAYRLDMNKHSYGRAKRRVILREIYDRWCDGCRRPKRRNWKCSRETQYRPEGRGQKHTHFFDDEGGRWDGRGGWWLSYSLKEYFEERGIPHSYDVVKRTCVRRELIDHEWVYEGWEWRVHWVGCTRKNGVLIHQEYSYRAPKKVKKPLAKPYYKERYWTETLGYRVTWWTNKRLDLTRFGVYDNE